MRSHKSQAQGPTQEAQITEPNGLIKTVNSPSQCLRLTQHIGDLRHNTEVCFIMVLVCEWCRFEDQSIMSSKRVSVLTFDSLNALSKLPCSRRFFDSVTYFSKFLSTATERWDFDSPNCEGNGQVLNPNQFFGAGVENHHGDGLQPTGNQEGAVGQTGNFGGYNYHGETNGNLQLSPNEIYENGSWRDAEQALLQLLK